MSQSIEAYELRNLFRDPSSAELLNRLSFNHVQTIYRLTKNLPTHGVPPLHVVLKELVQHHYKYKITERQYHLLVDAYDIAFHLFSERRHSLHASVARDVTNYRDIPWSIQEGNEFARRFPPRQYR